MGSIGGAQVLVPLTHSECSDTHRRGGRLSLCCGEARTLETPGEGESHGEETGGGVWEPQAPAGPSSTRIGAPGPDQGPDAVSDQAAQGEGRGGRGGRFRPSGELSTPRPSCSQDPAERRPAGTCPAPPSRQEPGESPSPRPVPPAPRRPSPTHRCAAPAGPPAGAPRTGRTAARAPGPGAGAGAAWGPRGASSSQLLGSRATRSEAGRLRGLRAPRPRPRPALPAAGAGARAWGAGGAWGAGTRGASALAHRLAPRLGSRPGLAPRRPAQSQEPGGKLPAESRAASLPWVPRPHAEGWGVRGGDARPQQVVGFRPQGPRTRARTASCAPTWSRVYGETRERCGAGLP